MDAREARGSRGERRRGRVCVGPRWARRAAQWSRVAATHGGARVEETGGGAEVAAPDWPE